jgi:hypothetical protein
VSDNAQVYGDARVYGNTWVYGNAQVYGNVINIIYACQYNVTAYCNFVQIGCKLHTIAEWEKIFAFGTYSNLCKNEEEYRLCEQAFKLCKQALERKI